MRRIFWVLTGLSLLLLSFNGRALADQVTASSSLNWASATFSGPVAPAGAGGNPASPSEGIGAFYTTLSGVPIVSCAANAVGWTPIACSVQAGPDFLAASANSEFDAIAAASVGYSSNASVYRDGTIVVGTNGDVNIEMPFSATITPTQVGNCGPSCNYFAQVEGAIFLFSTSPTPPFGNLVSGATMADIGNFKESNGTMSVGGTLDLADTGLTPGTYRFEAQLVSDVAFVPEPRTILLLGSGLFGLAGISLRKRFRLAARPSRPCLTNRLTRN